MIKTDIISKVKEFFASSQTHKALAFFGFTFLMTAIIASQNFFFQNIIENDADCMTAIADLMSKEE